MDPIVLCIAVFVAVLTLMVLRVPIAFSLLAGASAGIFVIYAWPEGEPFNASQGIRPLMAALADVPFSFAHTYELATIPLYIALGNLAYEARITTDLFYAMQKLLRRQRGGLAAASVIGCGGFAAISGSSVVCAATMGRIAVPEMIRMGYSQALATGSVAAGGTLGSLIPPSIPFILFAILAEESVGQLLLAGIVPGLLTLLFYLLTIAVWVRLRPRDAPKGSDDDDAQSRWQVYFRVWPTALLMFIIIGGLFFGFFTGIQAAAVSVVAALLIGILRGHLTFANVFRSFGTAAVQSAAIFAIGIGAKVLITLVAAADLAGGILAWVEASNIPGWAVIAAIVVILLIMGMFLDPVGIILLMVPITLPIVERLGYDVIWYAVVFVKLLEIGLITPPIGLNAFVLKSVLPTELGVRLATIFRGIGPYIVVDLIVLLILLLVPALSLIIPNSM